MNHEMDKALRHLIGKTIAHVIVKEGSGPPTQLFLVFSDDTYYEVFTGGTLDGASAVDVGGLTAALAYGEPAQAIVFRC